MQSAGVPVSAVADPLTPVVDLLLQLLPPPSALKCQGNQQERGHVPQGVLPKRNLFPPLISPTLGRKTHQSLLMASEASDIISWSQLGLPDRAPLFLAFAGSHDDGRHFPLLGTRKALLWPLPLLLRRFLLFTARSALPSSSSVPQNGRAGL